MSGAAAAFEEHAPEYTAQRRRLVPDFDGFYGAVVDVLGLVDGEIGRVLDLGAGTGLLTALVGEAFPQASLELLDASEAMLAEGRTRLGARVTAVHMSDLAAPLPAGPYDAVVSALAIHHLADEDKRALNRRVHDVLRPGGVFVNAEQVEAPDERLSAAYEAMWARDAAAQGATEAELDGARERMRHDRCADTESQLRWLREAGFAPVDCVYKSWRMSVMAAFKERS